MLSIYLAKLYFLFGLVDTVWMFDSGLIISAYQMRVLGFHAGLCPVQDLLLIAVCPAGHDMVGAPNYEHTMGWFGIRKIGGVRRQLWTRLNIINPVLIKVRGDFLASAITAEILCLRCEQIKYQIKTTVVKLCNRRIRCEPLEVEST